MNLNHAVISVVLLLCTFIPLQETSASYESFELSTTAKIIVVGDIHGDYGEFETLIRAAGIIDDQLNWQAGDTQLVSVGDLLDRGPDSRKVMDLFMRLEQQATAAGGAVHLVLGNHELMNLIRELNYVPTDEYKHYLDDESADVRENYWQQYLSYATETSAGMSQQSLLSTFNTEYPPGYFGHMQLFSTKGKYGRWLLSKPSILKINEVLFLHGGLSAKFPLSTLAEVNNESATVIHDYMEAFEQLKLQGALSHLDDFFSRQEKIARRLLSAGSDEHKSLYQSFVNLSQSFYLDGESQFWYRGSALCHPIFEEEILDRVLQHYKAKQLVIGHTTTSSRVFESRMKGKVINTDTGLYRKYYQGNPMLLAINKDELQQFDGNQWRPFEVDDGQYREIYQGHSYQDWEQLLTQAIITKLEPIGTGVTQSKKAYLEHNGLRFKAIFKTENIIPRNASKDKYRNTDSYKYEIAAYRIARHLGLNMIPPTVLRTIKNKQGSLQLWIDDTFNEKNRIEDERYPSEYCVLSYQASLMNMFDILIFNVDRTQSNILYTEADWMMWMIDHSRSFRTGKHAPKYLKAARLRHSLKIEHQLKNLDYQSLDKLTNGLLKRKQIKALLKRRDLLLKKLAEHE
ncbi:metallophosphoesterase [Shewanella sp. 5_MG-2023]|uniref:metallophosphoesterase n=1 Tax=Shewanella sp. 5_MG-2023 TaxID=3062656 RepID=UPI0026E33B36|nr:metallophosphoesterase [Shewanella sp. 5_MG-2023]MDO6639471.1 metallophosphoesterase [Shewanella sp. 5_MG-2023]